MEQTGIITNIQRFSLHDGPGIRTTIFFKGCPLQCLWCHNPETYELEPELTYKGERCISCGCCIEGCRQQALGKGDSGFEYKKEKCTECFECAENCPSKALFVCGERKTLDEVVTEVMADCDLYLSSGGGVTFSGGEATMQSQFLLKLCRKLKAEGIHTALDTCGLCREDTFMELALEMDLCLFDIKHSDTRIHKELTGAGNELILKNLEYLNQVGIRTHIRIPVIPGMNDSKENLEGTAVILQGMDMVEEITLLGYHPLGMSKVYQFNQRQPDRNIAQPEKEALKEMREFFQKRLPSVKVRFR